MTRTRTWAVVPGFLLIASVAALLSAYSGASSSQGFAPEQPIAFPHPRHVLPPDQGGLGMNCVYCHFAANKSPDPGMPAVGTCLGCHNIAAVGPNRPAMGGQPARARPEIKKLLDTYSVANSIPPAVKAAIPWVRIHKVPEYVHFPHMRHVNAGVTCQTCHGPIQTMYRVYQFSSLNMGWCINCHVNGYRPLDGLKAAGYTATRDDSIAPPKRARYDCSACHY